VQKIADGITALALCVRPLMKEIKPEKPSMTKTNLIGPWIAPWRILARISAQE
jgi:hypothetical protein